MTDTLAPPAVFDIAAYQRECWQTSEDHGFHDALAYMLPEHATIIRLDLVHSELAEALEEIRDGVDLNVIRYTDTGKPEGFASELADAMIRIMDLAEEVGVDLSAAVTIKAAYNRGRPFMHGRAV